MPAPAFARAAVLAGRGIVVAAALVVVAAAGCASTAAPATETRILYRTERVVEGAPRKPGTRPPTEPFTIVFEAEDPARAAGEAASHAPPPPLDDRGEAESRVPLSAEALEELATFIESRLGRMAGAQPGPVEGTAGAPSTPSPRSIVVRRGGTRRLFTREDAKRDPAALEDFVEIERVLIRLTQAGFGP